MLNTQYGLGRARELVEAIKPVERPRESANQQEYVARAPAPKAALDVLEREALLDTFSQPHGSLQSEHLARSSQRAISAYSDIALENKRDLLAEILGINEYA